MERHVVYADATTLIGLARIDRLDLLKLIRRPICVTTRVWEEVAADPARPGARALLLARETGLLAIVEEGDPGAFPQLDPGESTVVSAAAAARAAVLLDERRARSVIAESPDLRDRTAQVTGIIGLILLAKDRGYVTAVRPLLDDLLRHGFRVSPALYRNVISRAQEL